MYIASVLTVRQLSACMIGNVCRYKILFHISLDDWVDYSLPVIVLVLKPSVAWSTSKMDRNYAC